MNTEEECDATLFKHWVQNNYSNVLLFFVLQKQKD